MQCYLEFFVTLEKILVVLGEIKKLSFRGLHHIEGWLGFSE